MKIISAKRDRKEFLRERKEILSKLAKYWEKLYEGLLLTFTNVLNEDLLKSIGDLQKENHIELITSAATHGYLPLLSEDGSIRLQIKQGIETYKRHFGCKPKGIWLPECAYRPRYTWSPPFKEGGRAKDRPGIDEFLSDEGIEYFFVDSHLLKGGRPIGVYLERFPALKKLWRKFEKESKIRKEEKEKSPYQIYLVSSNPALKKPIAIFTRDSKTGLQVWSGERGYPGDQYYLEFHKKKFPGGLRYWRVTQAKSDLGTKEDYLIDKIPERVRENASHFVSLIKQTLKEHYQNTGRPAILCAPYDSELFGHWWFEGPKFIEEVLKILSKETEVKAVTCTEALNKLKPKTVLSLPEGSWGEGGFHYIWLNKNTNWTWKIIYEAEKKMYRLISKFSTKIHNPKFTIRNSQSEILKQLARELLLLQSSDWQFLITTLHAKDYAEKRIKKHNEDFLTLYSMAEKSLSSIPLTNLEKKTLKEIQYRDSIFPTIDPFWFSN